MTEIIRLKIYTQKMCSIVPNDDRVFEQIYLTFPEFFGKDKNLRIQLYGVNNTGIRIVPTTLFLGFLNIGLKKDISFTIIADSESDIEVVDIQSCEKATFTKNEEMSKPIGPGKIHLTGSLVLNEDATNDTSLKLQIVLLLNGERIVQELPCVYLVHKENL